MNSVIIKMLIHSDSLNEESQESTRVNYYMERRFLRDRYDILELTSQKFLESFRVSKDIFKYLVNQINPKTMKSRRITKIPIEIKLAAVLNFFATGSFQRTVGDIMLHSMDQSVLSRAIAEISSILEETICRQYIKFPRTVGDIMLHSMDQSVLSRAIAEISSILEETICRQYIKFPEEREIAAYKQRFFEKTSHPGVIGCIDGTHINIIAPREHEHIYVDRRGNHSMNVQFICNYDMLILSVCARFPGSTHDSATWEISHDKRKLQSAYDNGQRNTWLLGDSGYPLQNYLMTPFRNPNQRQSLYNNLHAKARNPIDRCIGVLKNNFRCLLGERVLRYEPLKVIKIVNVCAALYNICLHNKLQMINLPMPDESEDFINELDFEYETQNEYERAVEIRNGLLNCL